MAKPLKHRSNVNALTQKALSDAITAYVVSKPPKSNAVEELAPYCARLKLRFYSPCTAMNDILRGVYRRTPKLNFSVPRVNWEQAFLHDALVRSEAEKLYKKLAGTTKPANMENFDPSI
jgi:hypothetical protein